MNKNEFEWIKNFVYPFCKKMPPFFSAEHPGAPLVGDAVRGAVAAMRVAPADLPAEGGLGAVVGLRQVKEVIEEAFVLPSRFPHLFQGEIFLLRDFVFQKTWSEKKKKKKKKLKTWSHLFQGQPSFRFFFIEGLCFSKNFVWKNSESKTRGSSNIAHAFHNILFSVVLGFKFFQWILFSVFFFLRFILRRAFIVLIDVALIGTKY